MQLHRFDYIPEGFLTLGARELYTILPGTSLIELEGVCKQPLFISTLLHGNETTGFYALQRLLRKYLTKGQKLPRSLIILIGNIEAARLDVRRLKQQVDYNRIWDDGDLPEHQCANEIKHIAREKNIFASIDIHNNTGLNPYYACVNVIDNQFLNLARMFSRQVVYFVRPKEVLSLAFAKIAPSVTLEAGQSGDMAGVVRVADFVEEVMLAPSISDVSVHDDDVHVFHSVARIFIPDDCKIAFDEHDKTADIRFVPNFEYLNFVELPEHSLIGWRFNPCHKLIVVDEKGNEIFEDYFSYPGNEIRTSRPIIPSMFCINEKIIRQDCLGYIMQRYVLT